MRYPLEVGVLVALGVRQHAFHERTDRWVKSRRRHENKLLPCSITELGFVRLVSPTRQVSFTIEQAKAVFVRNNVRQVRPDSGEARFSVPIQGS